MIWGILTTGAVFIAAIVVSLGKVSRIGDNIAAGHREELMSRKFDEEKADSKDDPDA